MLITLATIGFFIITIFSQGLRLPVLLFTPFAIPSDAIPDNTPLSSISSAPFGYYSKAAIVADAPGCAAQGRSENRTYILDARETAPANATEDMFVDKVPNIHVHGPLAIAIPSELKGYYVAWKKFGTLPWSDLFEDSIKMCREGTPVTPTLDTILKIFGDRLPVRTPLWHLLHNESEGRLKTTNEIVTRPELGDFLERVAADPEALLNGSLVKEIADDLAEAGSIITLKDLVDYEPLWRPPLEMPLRSKSIEADLRLITPPPPSSGVLVGLALNALANFNYTDGNNFTGNATLYYHRLAEVLKFTFAKRSLLPDECCNNKEDEKLLKSLMTLETADEIAAKVTDNGTHNTSYYGSVFLPPSDQGTAHVCLVGPNGDAISITSTINTPFGSCVIGSRTGILFNNEMDDFSTPGSPNAFGLPPSSKHFIRPGARPISSMTPIIITNASNGTLRVIIGAAGGSRIITSTLQAAYANLNLGVNMKQAIDSIRIHHQLVPDELHYEMEMPSTIVERLNILGHNVIEGGMKAAVQGIEVSGSPCPGESEGHCLLAYSDYRKGGDHAGL
ncbi:unnamed protein product [Hymenolepis diminuta]|uniref:Gamma-glutamyltranspeptidase n=1 Tax=Hymenolepis diminuta TaxID=6216 RepID=A0A158QCU5_HYMDI|nr:unnamed protein product [Hymenolepis diminuta]